ncbi:type II toxin-antitoxin system YafQ family toxin [Candidatus Peregrinibacteria bacterium]|nr:type II toxin-antitoxin system YafQ family toxin [Candidatus Peregrinibacteria bacterium]
MIYQIIFTKPFKKQFKKYQYHQKLELKITEALTLIQRGEPLPRKYKEHPLQGERRKLLECHICPDLLLVYFRDEQERNIYMVSIGSHNEIFG